MYNPLRRSSYATLAIAIVLSLTATALLVWLSAAANNSTGSAQTATEMAQAVFAEEVTPFEPLAVENKDKIASLAAANPSIANADLFFAKNLQNSYVERISAGYELADTFILAAEGFEASSDRNWSTALMVAMICLPVLLIAWLLYLFARILVAKSRNDVADLQATVESNP